VARNIELKARCPDLQTAQRVCREIGAVPAGTDLQLDSYFRVPSGRLKIRESTSSPNSLILYRREDKPSPKESSYELVDIGTAAAPLRELLAQALGMTVQVRKKRQIFMYGQTRIHLDEVETLGSFIEFEYVLQDNEAPEAGNKEVERLRRIFGIDEDSSISVSYSDLVLGFHPPGPS
jgi:predicted adenylyl cyclase CyaB